MAGLVPAIHVLRMVAKDVDARDKRGHDGEGVLAFPLYTTTVNRFAARVTPV